ncbi:hypothetical protein POM88_050547 [Heracleum sosnowskyi]|uniref:Transmembrane protein n=1 Tax=Heracleum sosnowskyi TaxID=360622 RepID=A0AAD8GYZ2_9APIA|nr:hypothetical protein POM88_050547 [Heracleum sosnowskyi]
MVVSATTPRLHLQPSSMSMSFGVPPESLDGRLMEITTAVVVDSNLICSTINYVIQGIILLLKLGYSIDEYHRYVDWVCFAGTLVSLIGTVASLIVNKNRPPHKGRIFNFSVSLLLVGSTGCALAVHCDPRVLATTISTVLFYVTRANSQTKEKWYLLGDRKVPVSLSQTQDGVITDVKVSTEHAHLMDTVYQDGRNVALSVSSGEGVVELKIKEV